MPLERISTESGTTSKVVVTVVILIGTVLLYNLTKDMFNKLQESLQALQGL